MKKLSEKLLLCIKNRLFKMSRDKANRISSLSDRLLGMHIRHTPSKKLQKDSNHTIVGTQLHRYNYFRDAHALQVFLFKTKIG